MKKIVSNIVVIILFFAFISSSTPSRPLSSYRRDIKAGLKSPSETDLYFTLTQGKFNEREWSHLLRRLFIYQITDEKSENIHFKNQALETIYQNIINEFENKKKTNMQEAYKFLAQIERIIFQKIERYYWKSHTYDPTLEISDMFISY